MTTKSCSTPTNTYLYGRTHQHLYTSYNTSCIAAGELKYVCQTTKKLSMSRVVLRKKTTNGSGCVAGEDDSKSMDTGETQSPNT